MKLCLILALVMVAAMAVLSGGDSTGAASVSSARTLKAGRKAMATLDSKSGSTLTGKATFDEKSGGVLVTIEVSGAKPGMHGVHLHETGDCSAPDAKSAGGHFNPDSSTHGAPNVDPHHAGDFGNISVGADGKGKLKLMVKGLTVAPGPHSVVGRAVVVHADVDDLKSQPAGNSGARFACGVVTAM